MALLIYDFIFMVLFFNPIQLISSFFKLSESLLIDFTVDAMALTHSIWNPESFLQSLQYTTVT